MHSTECTENGVRTVGVCVIEHDVARDAIERALPERASYRYHRDHGQHRRCSDRTTTIFVVPEIAEIGFVSKTK